MSLVNLPRASVIAGAPGAPRAPLESKGEATVSYKHIRYDKADRIARVILNRPRYRNAQSHVMLEEMDQAFANADRDDDIRVIILKGEGDHYLLRARPGHP